MIGGACVLHAYLGNKADLGIANVRMALSGNGDLIEPDDRGAEAHRNPFLDHLNANSVLPAGCFLIHLLVSVFASFTTSINAYLRLNNSSA